jgi:hypothetical protein
MWDLFIEQIERRARVDHGGDFTKAAAAYFRDHPEEWRYKDEVNIRAREKVNAEVQSRIEMVAYREKLDLDKPADRVAAQAKVFAEDPGMYSATAANTVHVGKISVKD